MSKTDKINLINIDLSLYTEYNVVELFRRCREIEKFFAVFNVLISWMFYFLVRKFSISVLIELQVIKLTVNSAALGASSVSTDYVYIHDGGSAAFPLITTLYGVYKPPLPYFVSSQRYMFIRLISDNNTVYRGFNMSWTSIPIDNGKF